MREQIIAHLSDAYPWKDHFHWFDQIGSTNDHLRTLARQGAAHGTVLIADRQSGGHGRLGRTFLSPGGVGIYFSILLRPNCAPQELMHLTCATAVAMCDAVQASAGFRPGIKWTNDLVYQKRKLGGILTELGFTAQGQVDYAIIGIGINCCQKQEDFAEEIRDIAGSLAMVSGQSIDRSRVAAAMMEAMHQLDSALLGGKEAMLRQYRKDCITIGQDISLLRSEDVRYGTALDVDENGALVVRFTDGQIQAVNSGEVSVRGMYGYI
ncbi:MAG: biotin--[acetyl-CoA-carboxylase] ligase [Oscillospiraceae bacterium]|nr:biotin--[acetyl-CoA-carboxylase] ligase [Oscillospiraceae bacterium]